MYIQQETFTEPWKKIAHTWHLITEGGGRPSQQNIRDYEHFALPSIKRVKFPKALVLGSTPEIRDMLACHPIEVTAVDITLDMLLAMTNLMKKKHLEEIWVRANWLNAPLADNYYDLAFGDYIKTQLPFAKQFSL